MKPGPKLRGKETRKMYGLRLEPSIHAKIIHKFGTLSVALEKMFYMVELQDKKRKKTLRRKKALKKKKESLC
jgi:hypothetical protein